MPTLRGDWVPRPKGAERFAGAEWKTRASGAPLLVGALAAALAELRDLNLGSQRRRGFQRALGCLCLDFGKGVSGGVQNGVQAAYSVQPANRDIAVGWIDLDSIAPASGLLSCDQCRAGAGEGVENYGLPM